jgi:acetaldehyde dehydrogenase / alcohol dehydrogenase
MTALLKTPDVQLETARMMLDKARWATTRMQRLDRATVMRVCDAVAKAAHAKAQHFAEFAVRETGMGVIAHKKLKNEACSTGLLDLYRNDDFISPQIKSDRKIVELPRPAGVIFALVPVTNPVATVYFKTLLALMTRNAIILSPHPQAKACCTEAAHMLAEAARVAGAPDGAIQVISAPTIPLIEQIMADDRVDLIVATGGPAVVKAAYRSGNPAIGVGPGNAPVVVDDTADLKQTAKRVVASKSFDNSILCTNESTVLAFATIADRLLEAMKSERAHVCTPDEVEKLRELLFKEDGFNVAMIGKDAEVVAKAAGFTAPKARILVTPVSLVQPEEKLVREKLLPVLAFARVQNIEQAISCARSMMRKAGQGHSAAIHSRSEANIMAFASAVPALRVAVNAGCSLGASGFETHLGPSMTIGTGFAGGSSLAENLTPYSLMQVTRIAYNKDASEVFGNFAGLDPLHLPQRKPAPVLLAVDNSEQALRAELRKIILEELKSVLAA